MSSAANRTARDKSAYRPRRDILVALTLKAALLAAIYLLLVHPAKPPAADAAATAAVIVDASAPGGNQ